MSRKGLRRGGGAPAEAQHDFGSVIGGPGKKLTHDFAIKNNQDDNLVIVNVINASTCCGDVEWIGPRSLAKGEAAALRVTLRIGSAIGPLQHRAIIRSSDRPDEDVEFYTTATVLPRVAISETAREAGPLTSGKAVRRTFLATSYGTGGDRPAPLAEAGLRCVQEFRWEGPAREKQTEEGVIERSRPFILLLSADGLPGSRQDRVEVTDRGEPIFTHLVSWEIAPSLKAVPSAVIFDWAGKPVEKQVLVQSMDGQDFEIVKVESDIESLDCEPCPAEGNPKVRMLKVAVGGADGQANRIGEVRVTTSHPDQKLVLISVMIRQQPRAEE